MEHRPAHGSECLATARNAVWPWADPRVAATAEGCDIDLDWLLADGNTLYLYAPLGDQPRLGPVFATLPLVTPFVLRQLDTGDALLIHGTCRLHGSAVE